MPLKKLYIIGASDFGRDMESYLDLIPMKKIDWKIEGFLDDNLHAFKDFPSDYKILGTIKDFKFKKGDLALLAISDPSKKEKVYNLLKDKVQFFTYIAPDVYIGKYTKIGKGSVICPQVFIGSNVELDTAVTINGGTKLGHDVKIGEYSSFMVNISVGGHCQFGRNVFVGSGATIIPKRKVCSYARIGAGSVVIQNIKEAKTVFGNPATLI